MDQLRVEMDCATRSDAKVLTTGESGVGKEVVARLIHRRGRRHAGPFAAINCAGILDTLLESELFGHVRGSFTGAHRDARGWLVQAHTGTLFLDEVSEMSLRMQAVLLRFLENGEIQRVGADRVHSAVDVRIIAATNTRLHEEMLAGFLIHQSPMTGASSATDRQRPVFWRVAR
jgi:transcriptional regulator with PAS, ATPase and Fis domain